MTIQSRDWNDEKTFFFWNKGISALFHCDTRYVSVLFIKSSFLGGGGGIGGLGNERGGMKVEWRGDIRGFEFGLYFRGG